MSFGSAKVYFDGSHYIAIPREMQSYHKPKNKGKAKEVSPEKQIFEQSYQNNADKKRQEQREEIIKELEPYLKEQTEEFVKENITRKIRNQITRKIRLYRKVYINKWSYFCTFTYDDNKHNEQTFRKSLSNTLKHLANRKDWRYIGVWERSPTNNRLHFHALVYTPTMIGELVQTKDYSTKNHKMQTTYQNTHFLERYGRNDFKTINSRELAKTVDYLVKYIEKSGEKIVYSRNIPTYFVSDIMDEDIVCAMGIDNRKLLLFDDFTCWNEGELIGKISPEIIEQMPKAN